MPGWQRAFLGLGSNLGDRRATLGQAVAGIPDRTRISGLYQSDPVGGPPGQPPYLNLVAELRTRRSPRDLLDLAGRLEQAAGRERAERWGPRTLDVDVLMVGDLVVRQPDLVVPHPRMAERGFVLVPLADLVPEVVIQLAGPGWRERLGAGVRPAGSLALDERPRPAGAGTVGEAHPCW